MDRKHLSPGQTPWTHLSRWEMLKTIVRLWLALDACAQILKDLYTTDKPAYRIQVAKEMVSQLVAPIHAQYSREELSQAFANLAGCVAFDASSPLVAQVIKAKRFICPDCHTTYPFYVQGDRQPQRQMVCKDMVCGLPGCNGILRPMTWEDVLTFDE